MAEDRIDQLVDVAAVEKQISFTEGRVDDLLKKIAEVNTTGIKLAGSKSFPESAALRKELDTLTKQTNAAAQATINSTKAQAAAAKQAAANVKLTKDLNNEYKQLSLAYNDAALKAKNYSLALGANHPVTKQATADALAMGQQLKTLDASTGTFNRNVGNYGGALAEYGKKAFGFIRTAANIIPGLGLSGAFLLIFEGLTGVIGIFKTLGGAIDQVRRQQKLLNEVNQEAAKNAGDEIGHLEALYKVATNTALATGERKKAVDELQKLYPSYFKDIEDEIILQGGAAAAYEATKIAILESAKARAIESKLGALAADELDKLQKKEALNIKIREQDLKTHKAYLKDSRDTEERGLDQFNAISKAGELNHKMVLLNKDLEQIAKDRDFLLNQITTAPVGAPEKEKKATETKTRDLIEANRKAEYEIQKQRLEVIRDTNKQIAADNERGIAERQQAAFDAFIAETDLINLTATFEINTKGKTKKEIQQINEKANIDLLRAEQSYYQALLKAKKDFDKEFYDEDVKLRDGLAKNIEERFKRFQKGLDDQAKALKEYRDKQKKEEEEYEKSKDDLITQLIHETTTLIFTAIDSRFEREKNAIQGQIDLLDEKKQKDIEVENARTQSAQDRAANIAIIESRAEAQRQILENKIREENIKAEKFKRIAAIVNIIQKTAENIVKVFPNPVLMALAGAIGAVQIATVAAQPIPKYAEGGDHPGGLMIVGDGGREEGIRLPDGTVMRSPATSTLMSAPAGTKIYPDYNKMMLTATFTTPPAFNRSGQSDTATPLIVSELQGVKRAIEKMPQTSIMVENLISKRIRTGSSINNHITRNIN